MNKLHIKTIYPSTVASLLKAHELIEGLPHTPYVGATEDLEVCYPDDAISQALSYWLVLASGCGLVGEWEFVESWRQSATG